MQKISIHALREEGDGRCDVVDLQVLEISIHALREEGDLVIQPFGQTLEDFYPRPPRGGRLADLKALFAHERLFLSTPSARRATCQVLYGA